MKFVILNNTDDGSRMFVVSGDYNTRGYDLLSKLKMSSEYILVLTDGSEFETFNRTNDLLRTLKTTYMPLVLVKKHLPNISIIEYELESLLSEYPMLSDPINDYNNDDDNVPESADHRYLYKQADNIINLIETVSLDSFMEKKYILNNLLSQEKYYHVMYRLLLRYCKISFTSLQDIYTMAAKWGLTEILIRIDKSLDNNNLRSNFRVDAEFEAAKYGHLQTVKYLLSISRRLNLALYGASDSGKTDIIEYLVSQPFKVDVPKDRVQIALQNAIIGGFFDIIQILCNEFDIEVTSLIMGYVGRFGNPEIVSWFLEKYRGQINSDTIIYGLHEAALYKCNNVVKMLLDYVNDMNLSINYKYIFSGSIDGNNVEMTKFILSNKLFIPDESERKMYSINAATKGNLDVLKLIINDHSGNYSREAFWAAKNGHLDIVEYLYSKTNHLPSIQREILLGAAEGGKEEVLKYLFTIDSYITDQMYRESISKAYNYPNIQTMIRKREKDIFNMYGKYQ